MSDRIDPNTAAAAVTAALVGGAISYARNTHNGSIRLALTSLLMSGIAGLVCWSLCNHLDLHGPIAAICTGFSGHLGAEITRTIDNTWNAQ